MTSNHRRWNRRILVALALIVGLAAVSVGDAEAKHANKRGHRRHHTQRVVVVPHVVHHYDYAPRYVAAPVISVGPERFHWNASLGFYVSNLWVEARFNEHPPRGNVYYDPYCRHPYANLSAYRVHLRDCGHPAALTLAVGPPPRPRVVSYEGPGCGGY